MLGGTPQEARWELKNTIDSRKALSMSATATASTQSAPPIRTRRRRLRVIAHDFLHSVATVWHPSDRPALEASFAAK
jgi:hypothetical protein